MSLQKVTELAGSFFHFSVSSAKSAGTQVWLATACSRLLFSKKAVKSTKSGLGERMPLTVSAFHHFMELIFAQQLTYFLHSSFCSKQALFRQQTGCYGTRGSLLHVFENLAQPASPAGHTLSKESPTSSLRLLRMSHIINRFVKFGLLLYALRRN